MWYKYTVVLDEKAQILLTIIVPFHKIEGTEEFFRWISRIDDFQAIQVSIVIDSNNESLIHELSKLEHQNVSVAVDYVRAPGLARNSALSQINSKYVMFVDSDDYVYLEEINKLINLCQQPPVIIASYEKVNLKTKKVSFLRCPTSTVELAVEPALWRFIFKTSELRNIQFTKFRMAEDQIFLAEYFSTTKQVYSAGNVVYRYSVSGEGQISKSPEALKELRKALDYLETEPKLIQTEFGSLIYAKLSLSIRLHALKKILTNISFRKKVVQILRTLLCKENVRVPDPSFNLVWFVNG